MKEIKLTPEQILNNQKSELISDYGDTTQKILINKMLLKNMGF